VATRQRAQWGPGLGSYTLSGPSSSKSQAAKKTPSHDRISTQPEKKLNYQE